MSDRMKGVIAMVALAFIFACMGAFARYLQFDFSLLQQTYLRIGVAFLIACLFFSADSSVHKYIRVPPLDWLVLTFRAVCLYLAVLLVSAAYIKGNYSNVSFVSALPLLPLFGYFLFNERLTKQIIAMVLVGFVGVTLIAVKDWSDIFSFGLAELYALTSIIFFDLSYVSRRWHSEHLTNRETATVIFGIGALLMFIVSLAIGEGMPDPLAFSPPIIGVILIAALFNVANLILTNYGFSKLSITLAGTILTLETVFALLISIFVYAEFPSFIELVGSAFVLFAVYRMNQIT
ncbi:MAG: DMT family transporter [Patescibacteria group bacterium]